MSRLAHKALSLGFRVPLKKRIDETYQQGRTIDEIKRARINVILDVGANKGFYAQHLRMLGYDGHILSFEPDPTTFQHLRRAADGDALWHVYNEALGAAVGTIDFNVIVSDGETVLSSALQHIGNLPTTVIQVPVNTVAAALEKADLPAPMRIFLKMDTQGFDLQVFEGTANHPDIKLLQSEVSIVPLYEGMPRYTVALDRYGEAGFQLMDMFVVNRTPSGGILEYDALLYRE